MSKYKNINSPLLHVGLFFVLVCMCINGYGIVQNKNDIKLLRIKMGTIETSQEIMTTYTKELLDKRANE